jgi:GTPase SAR1 family protein
VLSRFVRNEFNAESRSTIGVEFATRIITVDDKRIKAQVCDTGAPNAFFPHFGPAANCTTSGSSHLFSNIKAWVEELREHSSPHIVAVLIGNKTDLNALRIVPAEEAAAFVSTFTT